MSDAATSRNLGPGSALEVTEGQSPKIILLHGQSPRNEIVKAFTSHSGPPHLINSADDLYETIRFHKVNFIFVGSAIDNRDILSIIRMIDSLDSSIYKLVRAESDDDLDRVIALEVGADDCVAASCGHHELKARYRAFLRRQSMMATAKEAPPSLPTSASAHPAGSNRWLLDRARCQICAPSGRRVALTNIEYMILAALFDKPNEIEDRSSLLSITSSEGEAQNDRTLDVYVSRVRRKLATEGGEKLIETVRGKGYRLRLD